MRKLLFILLMIPALARSQSPIVQVATGEYLTTYRDTAGKIWGTLWNGSSANQYIQFTLGQRAIDDQGGQYCSYATLADSTVRQLFKNLSGGGPQTVDISLDTFGRHITLYGVKGFWQSAVGIHADTPYYWGGGNQLSYGSMQLLQGGSQVQLQKWMPLGIPAGKRIVELVCLDYPQANATVIYARASDGTTWEYKPGSITPTQTPGGNTALMIGAIGREVEITVTATDIKAHGPYGDMVGIANNLTTPTSILSGFTAIGLTMPIKQVVSNYNTVQFVDANNHLFARGDNTQGEIGNGVQLNPWRFATTNSNSPWQWSFLRNQTPTGPVQITGKFYNVCYGTNIAFFLFAQDSMGNWYHHGRNKEYAAGNGLRVSNDNNFPDWGNIPAFTYVHPHTQVWPADGVFDSTVNPKATANAGFGQWITTTSTTLSAAYSAKQNGTITGYAWTKISGTGGTIASPSSATTSLTGLTTGSYVYQVAVTDNESNTTTDQVRINVTLPPTGCTNCINICIGCRINGVNH